jgi:hypothetical protein
MQEIYVNRFAGAIHLYQLLPAPPDWYAIFLKNNESDIKPIAAFGLISGPGKRHIRIVGLLGTENELVPVDCLQEYDRTIYSPETA